MSMLAFAMRTARIRRVLSLTLAAAGTAGAEIREVADAAAVAAAAARAAPGDEIVLADGEWRDADIKVTAQGVPGRPVVVRAASPGGVRLTGASRVRLAGRHVELRHLCFESVEPRADWLEFRVDSKSLARHCRVTGCLFRWQAGSGPGPECRWVGLYGEDNELDHCAFLGKGSGGATVVVWLGEKNGAGRHFIHHNWFGPRPELGRNGGETLRVGDSATSVLDAGCRVMDNWFTRCDGETECVSNKSCGNLYQGNVFDRVKGTLTLRHGDRCTVRGNWFLGGGVSRTGGIRLVGGGHVVEGNVLTGLEGDLFRAAICLVNGIPDSPLNGYARVTDADIARNHISDCKHALVVGFNDDKRATLPPLRPRFGGNEVALRPGRPLFDPPADAVEPVWTGNRVAGGKTADGLPAGWQIGGLAALPMPELREADCGPEWFVDRP
jgi:poly(beta-D-mannuronate) lyase